MSKVLVVFGATGKQGGSVVKTVLADPDLSKTYKVRAVTRDPSKESGKKLAAQGVEVVKGDLDDPASLAEALKGASAVFAVTNYWDHADGAREIKQGKSITDAAIAANVEYLIWSSLPHVSKLSDGALKHVYHFDTKATVEEYIRSKGIPAAFFVPAMFYSNLEGQIREQDDGTLAVMTNLPPDTQYPFIDGGEDTGKFVASALKNPVGSQNQWILGISSFISMREIYEKFSKKLGKDITYKQIPDEAFIDAMSQNMGEKVGTEMAQNYMLVRDYGYYGPDQDKLYEQSKKLVQYPLTTLDEFLARQ